MAGECQKLKFNRRRLGLSQKAFADLVGLSQTTICQLEKSEDAWTVANDETIDKIYAYYENMMSYQPNKKEVKNVMNDIRNEEDNLVDPKALELLNAHKEPRESKQKEQITESKTNLTTSECALKKLLNVAYHGLNNAKDSEEFAIYLSLMKKLLKK